VSQAATISWFTRHEFRLAWRDWLAMMTARDSARKVARDPEILIRNWGKYARGGGQGATARDMRDL